MNKFFKIALIGLFAIGVSDNLFSVDFQVGGIFYRVESLEKMTCIVCRPGNDISPVSVRYRERNIVIPQNVEYKGKDFTVVGIDNSAFRYCSELISITIPSTVEHIGEYAFSECKHLATVIGLYEYDEIIFGDLVTEMPECYRTREMWLGDEGDKKIID